MIWVIFIALILGLLTLDLVVLHNRGEMTNAKAAKESAFWISIALSFSFAVYWIYKNEWVNNVNDLTPGTAVVKYLTGYLIELSLSVDNLFVIAMIFASFKIPIGYQHKTLFWGIIGALVFRALLIGFGVVLIHQISWITYVFGALLLFTAFRMLTQEEDKTRPLKTPNLGKWIKFTPHLDGQKFFTRENGARMATPLFSALIMIEITDVLFAVDSIPAILAVTSDPFLVFSSNIFAILGLRALYFFLANMLEKFAYLKYSVFAILIFVGLKLLAMHYVEFPEWFSLAFIACCLGIGILVSIQRKPTATK